MALPKGKYYSVNETASILGLSEKTIRRRIKSGTLTNKKVGREYQIYIATEDLPLQDDPTITKVKEDKTSTSKPGTKKEQPEEQKETSLLDVLIKQLDEKDKLIKELNERIREAHVLASGRLLGNGKPEEQEQDSGEIIYATGQVEQERGDVDTKPTKDKKHLWIYPVYVLILLATLGLIGLMLYQSGIITL
jgi:excisionase family DNA binding protein